MRPARPPRLNRWTVGLLGLAAVLVALDVMTIFGSLWFPAFVTQRLGGFGLALSGGCVRAGNGDGFMMIDALAWGPPGPRRWWFGTNWFSLSGRLHGRGMCVPLWHAWLPLAAAAAALGPVRAARRRRRGECLGCGYPREGLSPDAPCPECGSTPRG